MGTGVGSKGVLYTASSDRTVRVWDAEGVSFVSFSSLGSFCAVLSLVFIFPFLSSPWLSQRRPAIDLVW